MAGGVAGDRDLAQGRAVGIPGRPRTESRQQFVLDMSRPEIVDHLMGVGPKVERLTGKVDKDVEQITYDLLTTGF